MTGGRVLVVGAVNVDLVVAAARLPMPGQTVTGGDLARYPGGKGGNQATAAARLGARVAFVGAIGADDMGSEARSALAAEGIDVSGLVVTGRPTGVALIVVDPQAENIIAVAAGANGEVHAAQVEAGLGRLVPGPRDVLLVSREVPPDGVLAALRIGREAGAITILNPAPADGLDAATIRYADIVTPNETELGLLVGDQGSGDDPERSARRLPGSATTVGSRSIAAGAGTADGGSPSIAAGAGAPGGQSRPPATGPVAIDGALPAHERAVVVTLGAAGALVVRVDAPAIAVPAPIVEPVDTTGAGDTFNGALAAGLADGQDLVEAVQRAVAAAACSTTRPGARGGMPTPAELEEFLARA